VVGSNFRELTDHWYDTAVRNEVGKQFLAARLVLPRGRRFFRIYNVTLLVLPAVACAIAALLSP
jgi:hypothetical protein